MLSTIIGLLLTASVSTTTPVITLESVEQPKAEAPKEGEQEKIKSLITKVFGKDAPTMIKVAECESSLRQHDNNGLVLRGVVDKKDSGVFQINLRYHLEEAEALKLDIDKLEHNIIYAKLLYDKYGLQPWKASKPCWNK